jgi:Mu transposase, C-terminal domain
MVTDQQVRRLSKLIKTGKTLAVAAAKSGMSERTARKYVRNGKLPSAGRFKRHWRRRKNPFEDDWAEVSEHLHESPGLQAKTLFQYLQRQHPGKYQDGQLRTLQRHVKTWRATEGLPKEVFFAQKHKPGRLSQSDFTDMTELGITIGGIAFKHILYHFVLTYSNWESGTVCFSESFESLSEGLQNALWELGGVPELHQTDQLSTAVHKVDHPDEFTRRYQGLMDHHGMAGRKIRVREPHENGDVEQSHRRFKESVEQTLLLRGSREFASHVSYKAFLRELTDSRNAGRSERFAEEFETLRPLPDRRLESQRRIRVRVGRGSTVRLLKNVYSVPSRLIGEIVDARLSAEQVEIWYAQRKVDQFPRLRGESKHRINYRHIIDWLVRKPGAFENYRYREDLFPTTYFRMAYDELCRTKPIRASHEYLSILYLAARENESWVNDILNQLLATGVPVSASQVKAELSDGRTPLSITDIEIKTVNLSAYDDLFMKGAALCETAS